MAAIYVDSASGSDTLGSGFISSPFKSIARGVAQTNPGDIIVVTGPNNHVHVEPDSVLLQGKLNIKIQTEPLRHIILQPLTTSRHCTFEINASSDISISGFQFLNAPGNHSHANAILIKNSSGVKILGNQIHDSWKCGDVPASELFKCENSSVELTGNFCYYVENSYPTLMNPNNFFSFISLSGNGNYLLQNNEIRNVHSNSGYAYGIKIYPDTGNVEVNDFAASNFVSEHVDYKDKMIGIFIESDNSAVKYVISNIQLSQLGYGLKLNNAIDHPENYVSKALIADCLYGAVLLDNNSVLKNSRNFTIAKSNVAVHVSNRSTLELFNTIIFNCETAMRSEVDSVLNIAYSVYYLNNLNRFSNNRGIINSSQFVRNIDPKFVNHAEYNFQLTDYSPCVDTGKFFQADKFLGNGPDIGYHEKTALITEDDLPSLLARMTRKTELVPLTEIDILGMVAKGIETSDGRIMASREGSAVKDVAVKPLDLIITPYHTELELIRNRLSFERMQYLSEEDADLLASNVFVKRDYGVIASGIMRVYFSQPTDAILYAEHEFKTRDNLKFYTRATIAMTKDEMALNYDNGAYYLDTVIDAAVASQDYNLPAFTVSISTMPMPPGTLSFTNPYEITGGTYSETNSQLKEKARYSITVRDIVTKKGARATMPEMFPVITDMRTIGYRDSEMERDYISVINDHIGGKSDIYMKTRNPVIDSKVIYPEGKYFEISDASFSGFVPILKILSIEILEPITESETGIFLNPIAQYKILSRDSWVRFSVKERLAIEFADSVVSDYIPATPFKVSFLWVPEMKAMQSVLDGDYERVVVADFLAKAFEPAFVSFSLSYHAPYEIEYLEDGLRGFVQGINTGYELQESDLVAVAYGMGATKVLQPMEMSVEHHTRAGDVIMQVSPDGIFIPRIATFWDGDITVNYLGEG